MGILRNTMQLVGQAVKPQNYMPLQHGRNLTEMPDTLILDNSGRVKVDYSNKQVRQRIRKVLADLKDFQLQEEGGPAARHKG